MGMPFDEDAIMIMLNMPEPPMHGGPDGQHGHTEHGPMEGMEGDSEGLLRKIFCMLKEHFGEECKEREEEDNGF